MDLKRFLILAGMGLLGMLIGYIVLPTGVYFASWEEFPSPPAGTVELLTFREDLDNQDWTYQLASQTANGETYYYKFYDGWLRSDKSQNSDDGLDFQPCTYAPPEFGPFNNAPRNIISCATATSRIGHLSSNIYALDKNGQAWRWEMGGGYREVFTDLVIRPCLGGLMGLSIGYLIIKWSQHRREKRAARSRI